MIDRDRKSNGLALTVATYQARRKTRARVADASTEWRNLPPNASAQGHVFFSIQTERKRSENYTTLYVQRRALFIGLRSSKHHAPVYACFISRGLYDSQNPTGDRGSRDDVLELD